MDFIPYLLQALCAFTHGLHNWYWMDFPPVLGFIFFNIEDSLIDLTCGVDDCIVVCQLDSLWGTFVRNHHHHSAVSVPFSIHTPDAIWCLQVEKGSVDCRRSFMVHSVGQKYAVISYQNQASLRPTWSRWRGASRASGCQLTLGLGLHCLPPSDQSGCGLRFGFMLLFSLLFELQFGFGFRLLLPPKLLWLATMCCPCMLWDL